MKTNMYIRLRAMATGRSRLIPGMLVAASLIACCCFSACSFGRVGRSTVQINIPALQLPIEHDLELPERNRYSTTHLIVLLDNGPPVTTDTRRQFDERTGELANLLLHEGYAVWRPFRRIWPRGELILHTPDQLISIVQLGLESTEHITGIDTTGAVLLGIGTGGVVAIHVAKRKPELVKGLAIINTPARSVDRILASTSWRDSVVVARLQGVFNDIWRGAYPDSAEVLNSTAGTWRSWLAVTDRLPETVEELTQPTLAIQGTADRMLPLLDIERYRRVVSKRPSSYAETALGVTHDLKDEIPDPLQDGDILSPRLTPPLLRWLHRTFPVER